MTARLLNRAERLAQIEQILSRNVKGMRAVEIAAACGVDRRTIYRDLALLTETGVPITQNYGRFFIDHEHYTPVIRLSFHESLSLLLAASVLARQSGYGGTHLHAAVAKLQNLMPTSLMEYEHPINMSPRKSGHGTAMGDDQQKLFGKVVQAWIDRRKLKLRYRSRSGKTRVMILETYFVDCKPNGTLYVVGYDSLSQRVYSLKLQQIDRIKRLDQTYQLPNAGAIRKYMWDSHATDEITDTTDTSSLWSAST